MRVTTGAVPVCLTLASSVGFAVAIVAHRRRAVGVARGGIAAARRAAAAAGRDIVIGGAGLAVRLAIATRGVAGGVGVTVVAVARRRRAVGLARGGIAARGAAAG